ncbi:MAG: AmmeMemoRadiSam system radical SAM enzyme [Chloroflexi bacterium]|nr:MAG: AmmeMemoRadiSam system radical SAM enzyme [Chloroflexota bacterium]
MIRVLTSRAPSQDLPLAELLDRLSRPGELYERREDGAVRCYACGHRCLIRPGRRGVCQVRFNRDGVLYVPYGYVAGLQVDPTEKKPFFHLLPGSEALTFGMLGCDFHCSYCQNWLTSQALRDPAAGVTPTEIIAEALVALATRHGARLVVSSYNEPLITSEWAVAIFRLARQQGLRCAYVSNGNATPEVLDYLRPWTDGYKIDLKTMDDRNYRKLGGVLDHVLNTIRWTFEMGFWVEVVTLVVPGFNDSEAELREAARFIASVSPDIPWHVTAFHKDYKMTDPDNTPARTLIRAAEIGYEEGLHYVYAGNLPGRVGPYEDTRCPHCHETLIRRYGFHVLENRVTPEGRCPSCQTAIAGIWR